MVCPAKSNFSTASASGRVYFTPRRETFPSVTSIQVACFGAGENSAMMLPL